MKLISCLLGLLLFPAFAFSQQSIKLRGTVYESELQKPLVGSHIYIKGTNIGTISDERGDFLLQVPVRYSNDVLTISYVGYVNIERAIAELPDGAIQISMQPEVISLDEVVITFTPEYLVEQVIEEVMTEYEDHEKMLKDFYTKLFELDKDFSVLKALISDEQKGDILDP